MKFKSKITSADKFVIFYHGADFDGECSGAITYNYLKKIGVKDSRIICIPINYGKEIHIEKLKHKIVIILDFSFPPEMMFEIMTLAKELHWIDHHINAIETYEQYKIDMELDYDIPGSFNRNTSKAACELAWEYFFNKNSLPKTVKLLSSFDICGDPYDSENDPEMMSFQFGLRSYNTKDIKSSLWATLLFKSTDSFVSNICKEGIPILRYEEIKKNKRLENYKSVYSLYKDNELISDDIFVINEVSPNIILTYELRQKHDFVCVFSYDIKKGYSCSIYTTRKNKSAADVAALFGGGGHREAAGFRCKELPFKPNKK